MVKIILNDLFSLNWEKHSFQPIGVALNHTHPYGDGDTLNDPRCPSGTYNANNVSSGDAAMVQAIKDNPQLPAIPMYVIDEEKIRIIEPPNPLQYSQTMNRCGY